MKQDICLEELAQTNSNDWDFIYENQVLILKSTQPMWIDFYNIAGIPFNDPGLKKFTPEYLQKNGKKNVCRMAF